MKDHPMTVFIVFASGKVDTSVVNCLCSPGSPDLIGYSRCVEGAVVRILENKPNVVIVDSRRAENEASTLLLGLRDFALAPIIVVLTDIVTRQDDQKGMMNQDIHYLQYHEEEKGLCAELATLGEPASRDRKENQCLVWCMGDENAVHSNV